MVSKLLHDTAKKILVLGLPLILVLAFASQSNAQTADDGWEVPVNLSRSGSAKDPQVVIDASGTIHVLWRDTAAETFVYMKGKPGDWSDPVPAEPPFGTRQYFPSLEETDPPPLFNPKLIATADGRIHAFWIDNLDALRHSWVSSDAFTDFSAWSSRLKLADSTSDFSVAIDENNQLYLSYIGSLTDETQLPGVNFQRFDSVEGVWSTPISLYESAYFQKLPPERANIQMKVTNVGDTSQVYLVWDNRSLEKLFFARSEDGGLSWDDPLTIIDQRNANDELDTTGPIDITLAADTMEVLLVWQAGHGISNCNQYYQRSSDGGRTWSASAIMNEELGGCPEQNQFLDGTVDGRITLSTIYQGQPFLLVWDGERWSESQPQEMLESFVSSETHRPIALTCHQLSLFGGNQIVAFGCGKGPDEETVDIWQTSRSVGKIDTWFPLPPEWSSPVLVSDNANLAASPKMVADNQGRVHAFWGQPLGTNVPRTAIFYTRWDGERWTLPLPVLTFPMGNAVRLEVVVSDDDRLMIIWLGELGEINFSQVNADQAALSADWSTPITLPSLNTSVGNADIVLDGDGTINVAYSLPVNESRGIYLTRSENMGESWDEPILVFDGAGAGWDVVGAPQVVMSDDGTLHLLWTKQILSADGMTDQALYYTRSVDQGRTFDESQIVAEGPIGWYKLVNGGAGVVYRFWQNQLATSTILRHDYSVDGGRNWSDPLQVSNNPGPADITADSSGQLHAVQGEDGKIAYYRWDGSGWRLKEGAELLISEDGETVKPEGISAVASMDQTLIALYASDLSGSENGQREAGFFSILRNIAVPEVLSAPVPTLAVEASTPTAALTAEVVPVPSATSTTQLLSTPTVGVVNNPGGGNQGFMSILNNTSDTVRLAIAFVPVGLFLILGAGIGLWIRRTSRN